MATSLAINSTKALVSWQFDNALTGSITTTNLSNWTYSKTLTAGTGGAGTSDLLYAIQTTIAGAGTLNLDLAGTLTDFFGNTITMARVKIMMFHLTTDTTASSILIGNHASALINWVGAAAHTVRVRNGGCLYLACTDATAYAVTATTADAIKILNEDATNTATLQIAIVGSTA